MVAARRSGFELGRYDPDANDVVRVDFYPHNDTEIVRHPIAVMTGQVATRMTAEYVSVIPEQEHLIEPVNGYIDGVPRQVPIGLRHHTLGDGAVVYGEFGFTQLQSAAEFWEAARQAEFS